MGRNGEPLYAQINRDKKKRSDSSSTSQQNLMHILQLQQGQQAHAYNSEHNILPINLVKNDANCDNSSYLNNNNNIINSKSRYSSSKEDSSNSWI